MNQKDTKEFYSIGTVISERNEVIDDQWGNILAKIKFRNSYDPVDFKCASYAYFLFYMDLVDEKKIIRDARHPRNDKSLPLMGILAQRGKNRPNQLGLSCAKIIQVDCNEMIVQGLDAIDATSILFAKSFHKENEPDSSQIKEAYWLKNVMKEYFSGGKLDNIEERIQSLEKPKRLPVDIISLVPVGSVSQSLWMHQNERCVVLNQKKLDSVSLDGLDSFSHVYVIYHSIVKKRLDFIIAKIIQIKNSTLLLDAPELPVDVEVFDIKPYTKLFLPEL